MSPTNGWCDVCRGTDLEPWIDPGPCGRTLLRCRDCGLVAAVGGDGASRGSRDAAPRDPRTDHRRAGAVMRLIPSGRILEIGCGAGEALAAMDPRRYEVVGVEPDAALAAAAATRVKKAGLRGAVMPTTLEEAGLPAETFDLVALFGVIGSADSPRATVMEASRLLRPRGYLLVETPSLSSLTARLCGVRWQPLHDPGTGFFFTAGSLERLAHQCGLAGGTSFIPMPIGWPAPGTLVYLARKSATPLKLESLAELTQKVGGIAPMGATQ